MKKEKKLEFVGAIKALVIVVVLCFGIGLVGAYVANPTISDAHGWQWGDTTINLTGFHTTHTTMNDTGFYINSSNIQRQTATFIVAASDSLHKERADYVCDGVDDQVEIQAAIDALPISGGQISLSEGTFLWRERIVPSDNIKIQGSGENITIINLDSAFTDTEAISITNKSNIYLNDFKLNCGWFAHGVFADTCNNIKIENVWIEKAKTGAGGDTGHDIWFSECSKCLVSYCDIRDAHDDCIFIYNSTDITVTDNYISGYTSPSPRSTSSGIEIEGGERVIIANNHIFDRVIGIAMHGATILTCKDIIITNNVISDMIRLVDDPGTPQDEPWYSGMGIYSDELTDGLLIQGNILKECGSSGIRLANSCANTTITGNIIYNIGNDTRILQLTEGIFAYLCHKIRIDGNTIYNAADCGIFIIETNQSQVTNNNCIENGAHGINIFHGIEGDIRGNFCLNNGQIVSGAGIYGRNTQYTRITENRLEDDQGVTTQDNGILLEQCAGVSDYNFLRANLLRGNTIPISFTGINTAFFCYNRYSDIFMDVLAVLATHVVNAQACHVDPTTLTVGAGIAAQPDVPRTLSWVVNNTGGITAADITITGIDAKGNTISEAFDLTGGLTGETNNAFATVSEVKIENQVGAAAGDTISVGITDVLGLSNIIYATHLRYLRYAHNWISGY